MNKRAIRALLKNLEASKDRIAKERNKLRDLIAEYEDIEDDCSNAIDNMNAAADALSEIL